MRICHRVAGTTIFEDDAASIKKTLETAVKSGIDLRGADLRGAYLDEADLGSSDLRSSDLRGAYLGSSDLRSSDLRGADLSRADLRGAKLAWSSHDLIAEILRRAARDDLAKIDFAGRVLILRDWCWDEHLATNDPRLPWALAELARWVQPDDGHPACLDAYRSERGAE